QTRIIMQQILTNMWQRLRISVLFVTHDIDEAIFLSDRVYVMTARPGRLKADLPVPLPRPRHPDMTMTPEFLALRGQLMELIREFRERNAGMTLEEYQAIYWWEYVHRLWGRLIGAAFLLPFLAFVAWGQIRGALAWRLGGIFMLGGLQGVLGWYMVQSGLADR